MTERIYQAANGSFDLDEVIGVTGDSYHSTVALRGGATLSVNGDQRLISRAWSAYQKEKSPSGDPELPAGFSTRVTG